MIDFFGIVKINVPTLATTNIAFHGTIGYILFCLMGIFGTIGCIMLSIKIIKKIEALQKKGEVKN